MQSKATIIEATAKGFRGVIASDGARGLWRGFPFFTIGGLPSQGAYFLGYNWAHSTLSAANARREEAAPFPLVAIDAGAGFFADALASPLWTPTEVISARMQIQGPGVIKYDSSMHAARHIVATEGVRGLFRGLTVSILAFGPASAMWWALYQSTHRKLTAWKEKRTAGAAGATSVAVHGRKAAEPSVAIDALAGLLAGCCTSVVTNPLDMAKTRLQTQHALLAEYVLAPTRAEQALEAEAEKARLARFREKTVREAELRAVHGDGSKGLPAVPPEVKDAYSDRAASVRRGMAEGAGRVGRGVEGGGSELRQGRQNREMGGRSAPAAVDVVRLSSRAVARAAHEHGRGALRDGVGVVEAAGKKVAAVAAYGGPHAFPHAAEHAAAAVAPVRPVLHSGLFSVLLHILRKDGARALIRGLFPRMLMQGPASAATFVAYEQVKRLSVKDKGE